ncbi:hypothetical protein ROZALSC1DRAFT_27618 [Rozella allomycis CSF55]|uniref:Protein LTV1 homolog n=1 Tax=Rozella allomycis (strain CSF55) TaxID=988480 RepID=A0A4P9YN81_ROZAC|nr:hypothetical protein ROZALSC1DRAFT_27618 [Rozella allomycis CSF55]
MGRKKVKPFIDKKKSYQYQVLDRSQKDSKINDENATPHVLQLINFEEENEEILEDEKEKEDIKDFTDYGIYFADGYDYSKHLKKSGVTPGVISLEAVKPKENDKMKKVSFQLPEDVFPSKDEEEVGFLTRALMNDSPLDLELDDDVREILYALDDEAFLVNNENEFEDTIVDKLNSNEKVEDEEEENEYLRTMNKFKKFQIRGDSSDEESEVGTRYARTNYSMTSSVLTRSKHQLILDEHFEEVLKSYEDEEIGDLESVQGEIDDERIEALLDEFLENEDVAGKKLIPKNHLFGSEAMDEFRQIILGEDKDSIEENRKELKKKIIESLKRPQKKEKIKIKIENGYQDEDKWDCQSVLTSFSNLENRPGVIKEESKKKKKIILNKFGFPRLDTINEDPIESDEEINKVNLGKARNKKESKEEKKARKNAIKNEKMIRRLEKKATQELFGKELERQRFILQQSSGNHIKI